MNAATRTSRLRRLRGALKARDWLGIGIELAVVTIGILLAFEIEQWGERRARAAEERQFLERLYREYQRAADELNMVISRSHDSVMRDFQNAFAARGDRTRLEEYASTANLGCGATYMRTTPFSDTAFQELINSGGLSIVSDPQLRARIRDLTTEQASLRDRAAAGREGARDQNAMLDPYYRYELLPNGTTRCFVDWAALFENPRAVSAAARVYQMHESLRPGRVKLRRMTEDVRADVGCQLGKATCRP